MNEEAIIIKQYALSCQACCPSDMPDDEVVRRANFEYPAGTQNGWHIRTNPELLAGKPSRNPCANDNGKVHIMLDC